MVGTDAMTATISMALGKDMSALDSTTTTILDMTSMTTIAMAPDVFVGTEAIVESDWVDIADTAENWIELPKNCWPHSS